MGRSSRAKGVVADGSTLAPASERGLCSGEVPRSGISEVAIRKLGFFGGGCILGAAGAPPPAPACGGVGAQHHTPKF
jgi:hypothetical protein